MQDVFHTERLCLRHLGAESGRLVAAYQLRNRDFFSQWSPQRNDEFFLLRSQLSRLRDEEQLRQSGSFFRFYLFKKPAGRKIIGDFTLSNIIRGSFQSCNLGYQLDAAQIGKGFMTEAVQCGLTFAFDQLHLHRIEANVMPKNKRSIQVAERLGLRLEGRAEKFLFINGAWEDHLRYALVREDRTQNST